VRGQPCGQRFADDPGDLVRVDSSVLVDLVGALECGSDRVAVAETKLGRTFAGDTIDPLSGLAHHR